MSSHAALLDRIRDKCHRRRWYGPDMHLDARDPSIIQWRPFSLSSVLWHAEDARRRLTEIRALPEEQRSVEQREQLVVLSWAAFDAEPEELERLRAYVAAHPEEPNPNQLQRERFLHPPASAADVIITEEVLGLPYPTLLRALYTELANGGFGPGYGLAGAPGEIVRQFKHYNVLTHYVDFHHPDGAIPLCDWGCNIRSVLDARTGQVLRRYMDDEAEAESLEEWLWRWAESDDPRVLWEFDSKPA